MSMKRWSLTVSLLLLGVMSLQAEETGGPAAKIESLSVLMAQIKKPSPVKRRATTQEMREKAALRRKLTGNKVNRTFKNGVQTQYFTDIPNYANSPLPKIEKSHCGKIKITSGIRKFVDSLPGLGVQNQNNLGQYIPVAVPDRTQTFGSATGPCDYYEFEVGEYQKKMHTDLNKTTLRGYRQLNAQEPGLCYQYLGPFIIAKKGVPVRVLFKNSLPTGTAGNLFLPVDETIMGAGMGPEMGCNYTQNRATIHLHGGDAPWISDGTAHQWITPAGETTMYPRGVGVVNVPDMPNPGAGAMTFFYPNELSSRMLFYHDHSYGITRLDVYAGEAAGYLVTDDVEEGLINNHILPDLGGNYRYGIPLVIQDKTFIPSPDVLERQDPTWTALGLPSAEGGLWFPHVYMMNQNPLDPMGVNAMGRWDYGPWFWPIFGAGVIKNPPVFNPSTGQYDIPLPNPSIVPEAFMDTPVVNGTAYPYLNVDRKPYRFRILNACNDRFLNLQLYYAEPLTVSIIDGGSGYTKAPKVVFTWDGGDSHYHDFKPAKAIATIKDGKVVAVEITDPGKGYTNAPKISFKTCEHHVKKAQAIASVNTEVKMITASPAEQVPPYYPMMDGRAGGVPDPQTSGPAMIQIGSEGGFLPAPVVLFNTPIGYQYNRRDITVLNVLEKTLFMGPAERADVIIDFSKVPKHVTTLILYNDAPAPVPGFDPRLDYYTNNPDLTSTGGAPSTLAGYGPNTRTVMQFRLSDKKGESFDLAALQAALPQAYLASQPAPVVPETTYPGAYQADKDTYVRIQDTSVTFTPVGATGPTTLLLKPKAIAEEFELDYGRMNAVLGSEMAFTNGGNQTTVLLNYIDPPVEFITQGQEQVWKITHNGVDTHAIHTHFVNMQVINRVGWDGMVKPADPNELGWKDTVRMNPLEDIFVAIRPVRSTLPFTLPNSVRPLSPSMPTTDSFDSFDPYSGSAVTWSNKAVAEDGVTPIHNFGWEYMWHCHLLGHEENDMMRPIMFCAVPSAPEVTGAVTGAGQEVTITVTSAPSVLPPDAPPLDHYEITVSKPGPLLPGPGELSGQVYILSSAGGPIIIPATMTGPYEFRIHAVYSNAAGDDQMISLPALVEVQVP